MKKTMMTMLLLVATLFTYAQKGDVEVKSGVFSNNWESLSAWECPEFHAAAGRPRAY